MSTIIPERLTALPPDLHLDSVVRLAGRDAGVSMTPVQAQRIAEVINLALRAAPMADEPLTLAEGG